MKEKNVMKNEEKFIDEMTDFFAKNDAIDEDDAIILQKMKNLLCKILDLYSLKSRISTDFTEDLKFIVEDYFDTFGMNERTI